MLQLVAAKLAKNDLVRQQLVLEERRVAAMERMARAQERMAVAVEKMAEGDQEYAVDPIIQQYGSL